MKSVAFTFCVLLYTTCGAATCKAGGYLYNGTCQPCPKGLFQDEDNQTGCKPCQGNTVAAEPGSTRCISCGFGKASELKNDCICNSNAFQGYRRGKRTARCIICKPGTFRDLVDRDELGCSECSIGYFQPKFGAVECMKCPPGTTSKEGGTKCLPCAETEYVNKNEKCVICPPGFGRVTPFSPHSGRTLNKCLKCRADEFKADAGFHTCSQCPPGTFSNRGAKRCKSCPKGTRLMGNGKCETCPPGSRYGRSQQKCVNCKINTFMPHANIREDCFTCSSDKVAPEGSTQCTQCPRNAYQHRRGNCVVCPETSVFDLYSDVCRRCGLNEYATVFNSECQSCGEGSYSLPRSNSCFTCPRGQALILKRKGCGTCPPGKGYLHHRAECEKCDAGNIKPRRGIHGCRKCERGTTSNEDRTACIPQ